MEPPETSANRTLAVLENLLLDPHLEEICLKADMSSCDEPPPSPPSTLHAKVKFPEANTRGG
ncbi:hypothetical protein N7471_007699 [Penicillium samsonianum]|uniref:uncharacterized protein n=1 Tax=Penicillium samsonianum TaxID=1882272 RepID=UPI0025491A29|nr:uncharacterized protein N7471_007699 [Penicillium samsonianum]KAJ6132484.1 hypothetical protein N7471_007699 [Penicillium samsonianum]